MWLFFVVFLLIWGGGHLYVAWRLGAALEPRRKRIVWALVGGHFLLSLFGMLLRNYPDFEPLYTLGKWAHYIGMGVFSLLFVLLVIKDLGWLFFRIAERASSKEALVDPERRRFLTTGLNAGVVSVATVGAGWGLYQARRKPDLVEVDVPVKELPAGLEGFRIVQLSDIHVGPTIRRPQVERIVESVNALDADLVVITGDLIEGMPRYILKDLEPIFGLQSRYGTYFCTGNHEYYWDGPGWCELLKERGMGVLNNEHVLLEHEGGRLLLAGCTDITAGQFVDDHASDPAGAKAGAPDHDVSVLLAHQPGSIHEAAKAGFDLQLSGHTHGGQFWPGNLIVGLVHPYAVGLNREDRTWIYVSRGTGYWGPPMRLKAPSEITVHRLVRGGTDRARVERSEIA